MGVGKRGGGGKRRGGKRRGSKQGEVQWGVGKRGGGGRGEVNGGEYFKYAIVYLLLNYAEGVSDIKPTGLEAESYNKGLQAEHFVKRL